MTETVYIVPGTMGGSRKIHTDETCHYLQNARSYRETDRHKLQGHREVCSNCDGFDRNSEPEPKAFRDSLLEMDADDVGGSA